MSHGSHLIPTFVPILVLGLGVPACTQSRFWALPEGCPEYRTEIAPVLAESCVSCHGPERAEGGYLLDSYSHVVALDDAGTTRVSAGDPSSLLLSMAEGAQGHPSAPAEVQALLRRWVTTCELSYFSSNVSHGGEWVNPHAQDFHGSVLRASDWDFAACAACHGAPDDVSGGSSGLSCTACHPNGATACNVCHGSPANAAPPRPTSGSERPFEISVGAHQTHVRGGSLGRAFDCDVCHAVPQAYSDEGHIDASPAEVLLSGLATADDAVATWDAEQATCSAYCHGVTLTGGTNTEPTWSVVDGSESACGACHGVPPPTPHVQRADCYACHPTVDAAMTFINPGNHIDGEVDLSGLGCGSCHGSEASPAPPMDLDGESATSRRGVGAHEQHLQSSDWRAAVLCADCHVVPASLSAPGHTDSAAPAEVEFGDRARVGGIEATWNGETCGVYCHGATLSGGAHVEPVWTQVDGTQTTCDGCHGLPPSANHPQMSDCSGCHGAVVGANDTTIIAPNLHINGTVEATSYHPTNWSLATQHGSSFNASGASACTTCHGADLTGGSSGVSCDGCHGGGWETSCTFCHGGTSNVTGAPPAGVDGETSRLVLQVGAHTEHVTISDTHVAWTCSRCHVVPTSALSPGHVDGDGRAEVTFDSFNPSATYSTSTGVCSNMYCHGNGTSSSGSSDWDTNPTLGCASCHGSPPLTGKHDLHVNVEGFGCSACHSAVVSGSSVIVNKTRHIDQIKDVSLGGWDAPTQSCTLGCHGEMHNNDDWW